jgi:adenylate kinase
MDDKEQARVIILFGAAGSGKSTQANLLRESLGLALISPGEMLRTHMAIGDSVGREVAAAMESGGLAPDETVNRMVTERIQESDCALGYVLDGYPRTLSQAQHLAALVAVRGITPVIVVLQIDPDLAIMRLSGRRQCPNCGALYHLLWKPPSLIGTCDYDGSKLTVRDDDREDLIRARLFAYENQTGPALQFLRNSGYQHQDVLSGDAPPEVISSQIQAWIRDRHEGLKRAP